MEKVSVVIPVHNGSRFIERTVKNVLKQTYQNIEVVLVENFSNDDSLEICQKLAVFDNRVKVLQSFEKGTSFARKKGVEAATGKYIVFSDQDDSYINKKAIENMYRTIKGENAQIVQFGTYRKYNAFLRVKKQRVDEKLNLHQSEIMNEVGLLFARNSKILTGTVWDKIYDAEMLKNVAKKINDSLFFAEDENLTFRAFLDEKTTGICIAPNAYYIWNVGVGFSSKDNGLALMADYEKIKIKLINLARDRGIEEECILKYNIETIYFMKNMVDKKIIDNANENEVIKLISALMDYEYIKYANNYVLNYKNTNEVWDELQFLASCKSPNSYYNYCKEKLQKESKLIKLRKRLIKMLLG